MIDYSIFYRRSVKTNRIDKELPIFDIFISAFNSSDRVGLVFSSVRARRKIWHIHPEYRYSPLDEPTGFPKVQPGNIDEISQVDALLTEIGDLAGMSLCIDITGFMRHVLVFLVAKLAHSGIREFAALYSEPATYVKHEDTIFSTTTSGIVRPVRGMAGSNHSHGTDYLIMAVGYDHKLISEVTNHKDNLTVYPLFAFPSLSPEMYQQSAIRASKSGDVALEGAWITNRKFAPANDPFSTAGVVSEVVREIDRLGISANIYLSPLSTKVQALGFALFWQLEGRSRGAVTMLLPECLTYSRETSVGLKRLWTYTIELS
jgi:hypothetical protein